MDTEASLEQHLCEDLISVAKVAISDRGQFHLAVPGGSVLKMLRALKPYKDELDWGAVYLYYVNHKIVPASDTGGTHTKALHLFINECGITNVFSPTQVEGLSLAEHVSLYQQQIRDHVPVENGLPVFDYMLIGSGEDGHIGSLYPGREEVKYEGTEKWVLSVDKKDPPSITLTLSVMNAAREKRVVLTGSSKTGAVRKGIMQSESVSRFPVCGVQGAMYMIDEACSRGLDEYVV